MAGGTEIKEEYTSSLADLTFNSKPLISVLTILAEENVAHAREIVEAIEAHLSRVRTEVKLPVLYLIDCIIKNVGGPYTALFCQNIVSTFCSVFEQVDERTRSEMFRLRQTWSDVIPQKKLYALDVQIKQLDPAWPLIASPPPMGIHLNPKFFMPTTTSIEGTHSSTPIITNAQTTSLITGSNTKNDVDPKTLSMQQKIINKQRELLELQQRKVQLELLQTQVKLQAQLKNTHQNPQVPTSTAGVTHSRNLLLKPEVAKQLVPNVPTSKSGSSKTRSGTHARSSSRISPVQGSLLNARPVRDPRLLRQLQQQPQQQNPTLHCSVPVDTKQKPEIQLNTESENDKIVNNKANVRNERVEHRFVDNNKGNTESQSKSKDLPYPSFPKVSSGSSRTKSRFSREPKTVVSTILDLTDDSIKNPGFVDAVKHSKSDNIINKSEVFGKLKFKKKVTGHTEKAPLHKNSDNLFHSNKVSDKKSDKYSSKSDKHIKDQTNKSVFKALKGSKNRAHFRRNHITSGSPEGNYDVDLRNAVPVDKIPRIQNDIHKEKHESSEKSSMDTDLRQAQTTSGKKRSSTDNCGSPAKKSKSEMFDVLFGSEDTDLRQKPAQEIENRSPTPPPPPIISEKDVEMIDLVDVKENKNEKVKNVPAKNANLDALRAKLANVISQDKLKESEQLKASNQNKSSPSKRNSRESLGNTTIIISPADEMDIKAGTMTNAQKTVLMSKILAQMETHQLREAQRRESETLNTSFQPISDDEFETALSDEPFEEESQKQNFNQDRVDNRAMVKDDRPSELLPFRHSQDDFSSYQRNMDYRDPRRGRNWRNNRHRQKHWDSGPPTRGGMRQNFRPLPDPWLRPLQPPPQLNTNAFVPTPSTDITPLVFSRSNAYHSIMIDSESREVRYYNDVTIAFLNSADPREISFHNGTRRISFDNESYQLHFNSPYEDIFVKGNKHKVKFGAPSREIIIDDVGYECYFDQKEKLIELDGNCIVVKLEPPPPQIRIGEKRLDLVVGKTQLVVDAKHVFPVFLDAKLQTFVIEGVEHTLKFVDSLMAAIIDDVRHEIEFGGLPKSILLKGHKYFVRFAVLPKGIKPGFVKIQDMEVTESYNSPPRQVNQVAPESNTKVQQFKPESPERTISPGQFEMHQQNCDNLEMLSSVMASSMIRSEMEGGSYSIENTTPQDSQQEFVKDTTSVKSEVKVESKNAPVININDLFQRLVATGIVATARAEEPESSKHLPNVVQEFEVKDLKPTSDFKRHDFISQDYEPQDFVPHGFKHKDFKSFDYKPFDFKPLPSFNKPDTLKVRRPGVIEMLYVGQQCSSCGVRFPPQQENYYKQHLDWHFRQNRKGRKSNRLSACRRWYYSRSDWKNYEEIEDLEERGKSYFETQAVSGNNEPEEENVEVPCISADADVTDPVCEVCLERLEQFYNEEKEEWQLRMAIRVDDKIYHPLCYDDYQASLIDVTLTTDIHEIPGLDGVEEAPSPEPNDIDDVMEVIDNIDDEVEPITTTATPDEHAYKILEENNLIDDDSDDCDDDVIINEVVPEKIIVDDDKEDDYVPPTLNELNKITAIIIKEEPIDDGFVDIEDGVVKLQTNEVKIKTEPVDDYENQVGRSKPEEKAVKDDLKPTEDTSDTTHIEVVSSIDGNFELESLEHEVTSVPPVSSTGGGKIKINITKSLPTVITKELHDSINESSLTPIHVDPNEPLPPGEEPVQLNIKPALQGVQLKRNPVVKRGSELTGLCSIM